MSVPIWTKVAVAIQTALAATKTISAITKANPGVATSTAHGYTNAQEVLLLVTGMSELNKVVVRVANVTANTFELQGIDTTLFGTFATGTAQLITFGAAASTFQDINGSGGDAADVDQTTIHDDFKKVIPGLKSPIGYTFNSLFDPADAALIELKKADFSKTERAFRFTFSNANAAYGYGYATCPLFPSGSAGNSVQTPVSFKVQGAMTAY